MSFTSPFNEHWSKAKSSIIVWKWHFRPSSLSHLIFLLWSLVESLNKTSILFKCRNANCWSRWEGHLLSLISTSRKKRKEGDKMVISSTERIAWSVVVVVFSRRERGFIQQDRREDNELINNDIFDFMPKWIVCVISKEEEEERKTNDGRDVSLLVFICSHGRFMWKERGKRRTDRQKARERGKIYLH